MTSRYHGRQFLSVQVCPACGADHPELEFKRDDGGSYVGRCYREGVQLRYDIEKGQVTTHADSP